MTVECAIVRKYIKENSITPYILGRVVGLRDGYIERNLIMGRMPEYAQIRLAVLIPQFREIATKRQLEKMDKMRATLNANQAKERQARRKSNRKRLARNHIANPHISARAW